MRLAAALGLLIWVTAAAQGSERRVAVDPNHPPWDAIAKVQTATGQKCTGALIAPAVVLTAAHCLYNPRTRALLQPLSLHVLFGFERDTYRWHRLVTRFTVGPGFDGRRGPGQPADWARLDLAEAVPATPLKLFKGEAKPGMAVVLAGYNQDRAQLLMADLSCQVLQIGPSPGAARLLTHDCAGTHGTSGAPLLTKTTDGWAVIAVNIAAGRAENLALAAPFGD